MGVKRVINTDFWKDDVVAERYSAEDRYFMLYLLTNPNTKQCGIYHLPIRVIAFEMGYSNDTVRSILNRFITRYKNIIYNYDTQEVAILNFLKHSIVKGGKPVEDCIRKELSLVKETSLIFSVYEHIKPHIDKEKAIKKKSMYVGIENVFLEFINDNDNDNDNDNENDNDNDNDNERYVVRIVNESSKPEKKKPEPIVYYPLDEKLNQTVLDFIDFRKKIKSPMTDRAIDLMISKLDKVTTNNDEKIEILNQSILNGWKGVFPLKDFNNPKKKPTTEEYAKKLEEWANERTGI